MQRKEVRLLPPGDLDGERDPDGDPEGHGGPEGTVMRHLALHPVLAHRAESSAPDERDNSYLSNVLMANGPTECHPQMQLILS